MNVIPQSIAFVCDEYPSLPHGGIGTFVQMLGRALVGRGYRLGPRTLPPLRIWTSLPSAPTALTMP